MSTLTPFPKGKVRFSSQGITLNLKMIDFLIEILNVFSLVYELYHFHYHRLILATLAMPDSVEMWIYS